MRLEQFDLVRVMKKARFHLKRSEYFEARAYLKRAYFLYPWKKEIKNLLEEVERNLKKSTRSRRKNRR